MTKPFRIGVFHPGTQHSWQTALAFQQAGTLGWYATSVFYDPTRWPYRIERLLPPGLRQRVNKEFRRRYTATLDPTKVRQLDPVEWVETAVARLGFERLGGWLNMAGNKTFARSVARLCEREPVDMVWGYDTAALELFEWAKPRGILCVLDRTIAHPHHHNAAMTGAWEKHPEFFPKPFVRKSPELIGREHAEIMLADKVVVGSSMCARTLLDAGCAPGKLHVVPYGFDESVFSPVRPTRPPLDGRPMRFLFAGLVGPRKGVPDLLKSFAAISPRHASLDLVGYQESPRDVLARYADRVTFHPPVRRAEVADFFARADCFIFPSLVEGGAIVLAEAIGSGLGIVQTYGGGEGATHDVSGLVLDSGEHLPGALDRVLSRPAMVEEWQDVAWTQAPRRRWQEYRAKVAALAIGWVSE